VVMVAVVVVVVVVECWRHIEIILRRLHKGSNHLALTVSEDPLQKGCVQ